MSYERIRAKQPGSLLQVYVIKLVPRIDFKPWLTDGMGQNYLSDKISEMQKCDRAFYKWQFLLVFKRY